ncbi:MAG: RNA polymerase sigma factor [Pseudomonadota bacterium]
MEPLGAFCTAHMLRKRIAASRDRLFRVALAWSSDPMCADDLVQDTLEVALDKVHQLRDPDRLYAWMYSIMHNGWRHCLVQRQRRPECDLDSYPVLSDSNPEQASERESAVVRVRRAIARLPVGQREVVTLVDLEGFTYQEVADILDIPIGTVMSRLSRARGFLQSALRSFYDDGVRNGTSLRRVK